MYFISIANEFLLYLTKNITITTTKLQVFL